jgi:uncharacterized protein (UPF0248 family)
MKRIKNNPRDMLNELKWREDVDLAHAEIWYVHRGAPNDTKVISGKDIVSLEKSFMQTTTAMIPYHRIFRIVYKGDIVFTRKKASTPNTSLSQGI